jgi:ribonuclease PH
MQCSRVRRTSEPRENVATSADVHRRFSGSSGEVFVPASTSRPSVSGRSASITGAAVALHDACAWVRDRSEGPDSAFARFVAALSAGILHSAVHLDLDYSEDSTAAVDLNVIGLESGELIEVQGTAERAPFTTDQLLQMIRVVDPAIRELLRLQRQCVS